MQEMQVQSLGWEDPLEQEMEAHSSICAWEVPRAEEPGGLQSMGLQRVRQDWARTQEEEESGACSAHHVGTSKWEARQRESSHQEPSLPTPGSCASQPLSYERQMSVT